MRGSSNAKSPLSNLLSFFNKERKTQRRRTLCGFEPLEDRLALSVATPTVLGLPDEITIYTGSSFHYTTEGDTSFEVVDMGNLEGMEAKQLSGRTVSITYDVTDAETKLTSTLGTVVIQLFDADAVNSSDRFYQLSDSTDVNFFEGKEVTRIASNLSIIQAGSPNGDLTGGSDLDPIDAERSWKLSQNSAGMVMFCGSAAGVGDQFYIAWDTCATLDYDYNVLGFVVSGYETLEKLSELETVDRSMGSTTEQSDPVDTIVMKDVTVTSTQSSNVFRLCAAAGTSGTTDVVLRMTDEGGNVVERTVTVNVVDLEAAATGDKIELVMTAGETLRVQLPSKYGDLNDKAHLYSAAAYKSDATASAVDSKLPTGVTLKNDSSYTYFELAADSASSGVFEIALTVYEKSSSGNTSVAKTLYYDIYIGPTEPAVQFSEEYLLGTSTTMTASTSLQYVISNVGTKSDLYITVQKDDGTEHKYQLQGGETDYSAYYTRKKVNDLYEYTLTLTQDDLRNDTWSVLGESDSVDGTYRIVAWQELDPEYNEHEQLASDMAESLITVLSTGLEFDMEKTTFTTAAGDISTGEAMTPIALTVDTGSEDITVASVAFAEGAVVPGNMAITRGEDSVYQLGWTPSESDNGYEYRVDVVASDSIGRQTSTTLVFRVSDGPSFSLFDADHNNVAGKTVNVDEAASVALTLDLTTDPEYVSSNEYAASYNLYKITTVDGAASKQLVDSGSLTLDNGIASWNRSFSESDGPGTYRVEFIASLASTPDVTTTGAVEIEVAELNVGPTITFVQEESFNVEVGGTQSWQLTATDTDVPTQSLLWSIDGTAPDCVTLTSEGMLTFAPALADSDSSFIIKVVVSDGSLTDSMDLSFAVPLWVDPGDNSEIVPPDALQDLATSDACITAWGNVNEYRLEQIQESKDRFLSAFTQAAETFKATISSLASQLQAGTITHEAYEDQCEEAVVVKEQEQAKNALNLETRNAKINQYAQEQYDAIASTGSTLGVELSAEDAIDESEPLHLTYAEMQQIWQASLPCFSALSASAVDAVLASYLS